MIAASVPVSIFGWTLGNADAGRVEARAKVQAASPINESRFMMYVSLGRVGAVVGNASVGQVVPWSAATRQVSRTTPSLAAPRSRWRRVRRICSNGARNPSQLGQVAT